MILVRKNRSQLIYSNSSNATPKRPFATNLRTSLKKKGDHAKSLAVTFESSRLSMAMPDEIPGQELEAAKSSKLAPTFGKTFTYIRYTYSINFFYQTG